jgi:cell wall-associated protease
MDHLARGLEFAIYGTPDLSLTELTADLASPQPSGTPITFTATASGGTSPTEFKWWIRDGGVWFVAQDWSTNNTVIWTPAVAGNYGIAVWARSNGNPDDAPENNAFAGMNFSIAADDPCYGCWDY